VVDLFAPFTHACLAGLCSNRLLARICMQLLHQVSLAFSTLLLEFQEVAAKVPDCRGLVQGTDSLRLKTLQANCVAYIVTLGCMSVCVPVPVYPSLPPTLLSAVVPFDGSCEEFEAAELEEAKGLTFLDG